MKRLIGLSLFACLLVSPLAAQKKGKKVAADVQAQEDSWVAALKVNDMAALEKLLSPDLVYTHSTGIVEDKAAYLGKLKSGDQKYAGVEYSEVKTQVLGRAAVMSATVRMTGATKGVPFDNKLKMLNVWAREKDGSWQLVAHQTTKLP